MGEIRIDLKNLKVIEKQVFVFNTDNRIIFIKGSNEKGKSTFLQMVKAFQTAELPFTEPVTIGEDEMVAKAIGLIGADGKPYIAQCIKREGKPAKWLLVDEEGKKISNVTDYRKVFQYEDFCAEDFMRQSLNAKGREEQKKLFFSLLDAESKKSYEIAELEEKVAFSKRTDIGRDVITLTKLVEGVVITDQEREMLSQEEEGEKVLADLRKQRLEVSDKIAKATIQINNKKNLEQSIKDKTFTIKSNEDRIVLLIKEIETLQQQNKVATDSVNIMQEELGKIIIKEVEPPAALDARILKGETALKAIAVIADKAKELKQNTETLTNLSKSHDDLTTAIEAFRQSKINIIANSTFPVKELHWDEEKGLMWNKLSFNDKQISTAQAWKIGAKIQIALNKSPLLIMGSAGDLDNKSLQMLKELAEEHDCTMLFEEVNKEDSDLHIAIYET